VVWSFWAIWTKPPPDIADRRQHNYPAAEGVAGCSFRQGIDWCCQRRQLISEISRNRPKTAKKWRHFQKSQFLSVKLPPLAMAFSF
jgi:hypothetical protein